LSGEYAKVGLDLTNVVGAKTISASDLLLGLQVNFPMVPLIAEYCVGPGIIFLPIWGALTVGGRGGTNSGELGCTLVAGEKGVKI